MAPEQFVKRLEAISSPYGTLTPELRRLADAEANCAAEIGRYKGYGRSRMPSSILFSRRFPVSTWISGRE
jgi:hypothetical protein